MKILHVTFSINPSFGGVSSCVRTLVKGFAELGHSSEIVCLDAPDSPFLNEGEGVVHALGPVKPGYGYSPRLRPWLEKEAKRFGAVIVHGLWQYQGLAVHRALPADGPTRYFVFPHGMLDPWFKKAYPLKHFKKMIYWRLAERAVLRGAAAVLFTCEEEMRLAKLSFSGASYHGRVLSFGTALPPDDPENQRTALFDLHPELRYRPYWLFFGRIHPKKGVELLIDAYATLARLSAALPRLVIAGPCDDPAYLAALHARAAKACPPDSVAWTGMLTGDAKWGALRGAEVFVLPSHQENFGLAVAESLACGTPVLLSDQVNIWREIIAEGAGLVASDTAVGVLQLLSKWRSLDVAAKRAMEAAATRCFLRHYELGASARSLLAVLQSPVPSV